MRFVSFELATLFLGGHNSLSQTGTWKCRGYLRLRNYVDLAFALLSSELGKMAIPE
jgi:hypothetical protein